MKRINFLFSILISGALFVSCGNEGTNSGDNMDSDTTAAMNEEQPAEAQTMTATIDQSASTITWTGTMVGVYSHTGTVKFTEGNLTLQGGRIVGGSFTADLSTITPTDDNFDPEKGKTKEKLVTHLKSKDFFLTETYPTAHFEITGSSPDDNTLTGNLTIRGITHEETIKDVSYDPTAKTATGKLTFDRKNYEVMWDAAQEMVLSNDVELNIMLKLNN